jgi:hypothetical protein
LTDTPTRLEGDQVTSTSAAEWREVARRVGDGIEVALFWNGLLSRVKVMVGDRRLCQFLDLEVDQTDAVSEFRRLFADAAPQLQATDLQADLSRRLSPDNEQRGLEA